MSTPPIESKVQIASVTEYSWNKDGDLSVKNIATTGGITVTSTTQGIVFPTMTTTQKNAMANVAGTQVFDTTLSKMCFNTGVAWETITSA